MPVPNSVPAPWRPAALLALGLLLAVALPGCSPPTEAEMMADARAALAEGDDTEARIHLMNLLKASEGNLEALLLLAELDLDGGNATMAELGFARAAKLRPGDPRARAGLARAMAQQERVGEALELLDPEPGLAAADRARLLGLKGTLLTQQGDHEAARAALAAALAATPEDPDRLVELALLEIAAGRPAEADRLIAEALARDPEHVGALLARGSRQSAQQLLTAAEATFERAARLAADQHRRQQRLSALLALAEAQLLRQRTDAAADTLAALDAIAPAAPAVRFVRASIAAQRGEDRRAIDELLEILRESPDDLPARRLLGLAYAREGRWNMAENHLAAVAAQRPADEAVRRALVAVRARQAEPDLDAVLPGRRVVAPADRRRSLTGEAAQQLAYGRPAAALELFSQAASEFPEDRQVVLGQAAALIADRRFDAAIEALGGLTDPDTLLPRTALLLSAHIGKGDAAEAIRVAGALPAQHPGKAWPHDLHAIALKAGGRDADAAAALRSALAAEPRDAFALTTLINLGLAAGDVAGADALAARLPDDAPAARLLRAMVAMQKGDVAGARELAAAIVAAEPDNPDGHNVLGLSRLAGGAPAAAVPHFETAQLLAPKVPVYALNLATAYLAIGAADAAAIAAAQARANGADPAALAELDVRLALARRDYAAAERLLERVTPDDPASTGRQALLAELRAAQGDPAGAAQALVAAYERAPTRERAVAAARAMQAAGRQDAAAPLDAWTARSGPDPAIAFARGELALAAGDVPGARSDFEQALRLDPGHAPSLNNLAWLYNEARDPRAVALADRALRAAPDDPRILDTVGWVWLGAGRTRAAIEVLDKALGLAPGTPDIQYHLAAALRQDGQAGRARQLLVEALRGGDFASRAQAERALDEIGDDRVPEAGTAAGLAGEKN